MFGLTEIELNALRLSFKVTIWGMIFTFPIALFTAWLLSRKEFIGKSFLNAFVHIPLVVPPVVIGYFLILLLGREGYLGRLLYEFFGLTLIFTWQGAAIAASIVSFPLFVRPIRQAFEMIDPALEEAASSLGANQKQKFIYLILPIIMPGIITGAILFIARALGEFGATITFASNIIGLTQTLPLAIYQATITPDGDKIAIRLIIISLTLAFSSLLLSEYLSKKYYSKIKD
ncbi:MAG: molybdate ABC transporter permease [Alphaproteobacteria bacterium TMED87]|nr:molybdate ABC transporter permease subunit [Rhodospirillaceae bacterium]OUV11894.1 MAG: molybdate ABC transporter permease [Alphaproteobacteria bacterium TMED87]